MRKRRKPTADELEQHPELPAHLLKWLPKTREIGERFLNKDILRSTLFKIITGKDLPPLGDPTRASALTKLTHPVKQMNKVAKTFDLERDGLPTFRIVYDKRKDHGRPMQEQWKCERTFVALVIRDNAGRALSNLEALAKDTIAQAKVLTEHPDIEQSLKTLLSFAADHLALSVAQVRSQMASHIRPEDQQRVL